jgi:hypothetical protein
MRQNIIYLKTARKHMIQSRILYDIIVYVGINMELVN